MEILRQLKAVQEEKRVLRLEMLERLEAVQEEKRALAEEGERIHTVLMEKDATISAMSEQLTKTKEYLTTKQQVSTCTIFEHSLMVLETPKINYKYGSPCILQ